jgi:hypothetical protein
VEELPLILRSKPITSGQTDNELRKLLVDLYNQRLLLTCERYKDFEAGRGTIDALLDSARGLMQSAIEVRETRKDRLDMLQQLEEIASKLSAFVSYQQKQGAFKEKAAESLLARIREYQLEVQIETVKLKKASGSGNK